MQVPELGPEGEAVTKCFPFAPNQDAEYIEKVSNHLFDFIMPTLSPTGWMVLCLIFRKTTGWHKEADDLSIAQIKKGTGIKTDATVIKAINELEKKSYIVTIRRGDTRQPNTYALNSNLEIDVTTTKNEVVNQENGHVTTLKNEVATTKNGVDTTKNVVVNGLTTSKNEDTKEYINREYINRESVPEKPKPGPLALSLAKLCSINLETLTSSKATKEFSQALSTLVRIKSEPEQVSEFGKFWKTNWRGKNGSPPLPSQVCDLWGEYQEWANSGKNYGQPKKEKIRISAI